MTVTLGLFILVNGLARWIWGSTNRGFPSLFPDDTVSVGGVGASLESLGLVAVLLGVVGVLYLIFQRTEARAWRCAPPPSTRPRAGSSASRSGGC